MIGRALTQHGAELRIGQPTARKGERAVPLDRETVGLPRAHRRAQAEEARRWRRVAWHPVGDVQA